MSFVSNLFGSKNNQQQTTQSSIPQFQLEPLQWSVAHAGNLRDQGLLRPYNPMQTYGGASGQLGAAGVNEQTAQDLYSRAGQLASQYDRTIGNALGNLENIASGNVTVQDIGLGEANPYLQNVIDRSVGTATSAVDARLAKAGRSGSGAGYNAIATTAGDIANQANMSDYQQRRAMQQQNALANFGARTNAAAQMPGAAQSVFGGLNAQAQAGDYLNRIRASRGSMIDADTQQRLADANRYGAGMQGAGLNELRNYLSLIQGDYGRTQTSTGGSNTQPGIGQSLIGLTALGGGLLNLFG